MNADRDGLTLSLSSLITLVKHMPASIETTNTRAKLATLSTCPNQLIG